MYCMPWIDKHFLRSRLVMTDIETYRTQYGLFEGAYVALSCIYDNIFTQGHSMQLKALAVGFRDLVRHIEKEFQELPHYAQFTSTYAVDSEISEKRTKYEVMQADLLLLLIQAQTDLQRFWIDLGIYEAGALVYEKKNPGIHWNTEEYNWTKFCESVTKLSKIPSLQSTMQWERERERETRGGESIEERSRKREREIMRAREQKEREEVEAIKQKEKERRERAMRRKEREKERETYGTDKLHGAKGKRDKSNERKLHRKRAYLSHLLDELKISCN